jgi:hypothetical protein
MEDFNNAEGRPTMFSDFLLNNKDLFDRNVMNPQVERDISGVLIEKDVQVDELSDIQDPAQETLSRKENSKKNTFIGAKIGSSLGFIVALGYAFKVKSGFFKGWGYTILGSMALGGLGAGVGLAIDSSKNRK